LPIPCHAELSAGYGGYFRKEICRA